MTLRSEMDDRAGPLLIENAANQYAIRDVTADKAVPVVLLDRSQVLQIPGIRQLVQDDHRGTLFSQPLQNES
jgi:hypothetical protein